MLVDNTSYFSRIIMACCLNPDCPNPLNQDSSKYCLSCGTELIPRLRNRFKIIRPLGQGGFGKTYLAEDADKLNRSCVIKQLFYQGQSSNANQKIVELFMREAEQLDQLKVNQQVPDLLAYFEEGGFLYLAQEYIEGEDLLRELQQEGPFSEGKIIELLLDLLPVLEFIHKKGLIHRDLKPENIMRRKQDGRLVLIDFGVARQVSMSQLSITGTKVGSPGYFSVEQFAEGKATASSDLYSLGATVFHLMTGQYPGELWTMQGYGWVNNWQEHVTNSINPKLDFLISKLLQIKAETRYQTANEVLADLIQPDAQTESENALHYEEEFKKAVSLNYPLDDYVRNSLKQLQQSLGLTKVCVASIEQPILKQIEAKRQKQFRQQLVAKQKIEETQFQKHLRLNAEARGQVQQRQQGTSSLNPIYQYRKPLTKWNHWKWSLSNSIGYPLGFLVVFLISQYFRSSSDLIITLAFVIPFAGLGSIVGLFQWIVLRKYFPNSGFWILGSGAGYCFGVLVSTPLFLIFEDRTVSNEAVLALSGIIMGISIGLFQWLVLKRYVPNAQWWILVNTVSFGLMPSLFFLVLGDGWISSSSTFVQIGICLGASFFIYIISSGILLKRLLILLAKNNLPL